MKIKISVVVVILAALSFFAFRKTTDKQVSILKAMVKTLQSEHFSDLKFDDSFSKKVFTMYLEHLDLNKKFFLSRDIDELKKYEMQVDDELQMGSNEFYNVASERFKQRVDESEKYMLETFDKPFEFTGDETIQLDSKKILWAKGENEMRQQWYITLKYQVLSRYSELLDEKATAIEKNDTSYKIRTDAELEIDSREKTKKANVDYFKRLRKLDEDERFSVYLNCITSACDPHSDYFTPPKKQEFNDQMSGSFEGIGAQLQEKDGFVKVTSIITGSASWRQGQLKVDDIIMKVAQANAEPVSTQDMPLNDVVKMIRGKKGTEVRLTVKKPDGSTLVIAIIRDIVLTDETFAKSMLIKEGKNTIGYIYLPEFYADFSKRTDRRCATDVLKEIVKLQKDNAQGIILDLRNNGGGSLSDVVDMAGFFVKDGPMVQVKDRRDNASQLNDEDIEVRYSGALIIMVNELSASASEIMAAAMQDYKRAVIIGSPSTFGKGTVQRVFELDNSFTEKGLGSVKITTSKFYRINGSTTQLKGVIPDIILPDQYKYLDIGEKDEDYPLAFDEIKKATYDTWNRAPEMNKIREYSTKRVDKSEAFKLIEQYAKRLKNERDNQVYSLNIMKYKQELKLDKEANKKNDLVTNYKSRLKFDYLSDDQATLSMDTVKQSKAKTWVGQLQKDVYLEEAVNVMQDMLK
ncbi:MAG: carboxy terminal-processing peptidase [Bacteroidetes bacterium]|nr:carboxy terminal-processing peptidase [Bacteroidota bacterium]